jgi:hypothetical protein
MIKSITRLALATATLLCAQERMRPGLWENTITAAGRSSTHSHCATPAELATANGSIQVIRESMLKPFAKIANGSCMLKDLRIDGNSLISLMVCGTSSYASTSIFHGETVETTIRSTNSGVATVSHISARRLGVCP